MAAQEDPAPGQHGHTETSATYGSFSSEKDLKTR